MMAEPVTVVVRRRVKRGLEREAEEWMRGISVALSKYPGALGVEVIRPHDPDQPQYYYVFRFDSEENLRVWNDSDERKQWLETSSLFMDAPPEYETLTGLEYWFTPPPGKSAPLLPPPRYKMALLTWAAIVPLAFALSYLLPLFFDRLPSGPLTILLRTMTNTTILVILLTYFVMPRMTRAFAGWLYRGR
jgi:antibiotic biosynthesis monooxygenase (ABM) superfamily enzyme